MTQENIVPEVAVDPARQDPYQVGQVSWTSPETKLAWEAHLAEAYGLDRLTLASQTHTFRGIEHRRAAGAMGDLLRRFCLTTEHTDKHKYRAMSSSGIKPDGEWLCHIFIGSPTASQQEVDEYRERVVGALASYLDDLRDVRL